VNYIEGDKVVLRLTRREAREVLLALNHAVSAKLMTATSTRVVELIQRRIERSWETKWPEVGQ